MSIGDKAQEIAGKAKEQIGKLVDNEDLENSGKADQTKGQAKDAVDSAGDKIEDAANEALGSVQDLKDDDEDSDN